MSLNTPPEIKRIVHATGIDGNSLVGASKLIAKVDNTAIQDGHLLYFNNFIASDQMPAMIKGFIHQVLRPGGVYGHHPRGVGLVPLLKNLKTVIIITTMNKPKLMYFLFMGNLLQKVMLKSV